MPGNALVALGDGFIGNMSVVVGANTFTDSTRLEILPGFFPKTAIGFNIEDPIGATGNYDVTVSDPAGGVLFSGNVPAGFVSGSFMGYLSEFPIGSIEIFAAADGGELLDNIQLWEVPEPSTVLLFGLALVMGIRRR